MAMKRLLMIWVMILCMMPLGGWAEENADALYPIREGGLWGYIALDEDCETIYGTYFSHESETAGLGARIVEQWFQDSFQGKKLYADGSEDVVLSVVKKGKEGSMSPDNYVNGVTGATLTSNGVNDMIQDDLKTYQDILKAQKK